MPNQIQTGGGVFTKQRDSELTTTGDQRQQLVSFPYIHKSLKVNARAADSMRNYVHQRLMRDRKLILLLDVDHTLLHSVPLLFLSPRDWVFADDVPDHSVGDQNQSLFLLEDHLTHLRPYVRDFLKEASKMFDMYIYTMASHGYAQEVAKLLDPDNELFKSKIISGENCTQSNKKDLDVVLGHERIVVILDDTEQVWEKHRDNLIVTRGYHYFSSIPPRRPFDFDVLGNMLNVLKLAHQMFFDSELGTDLFYRDVREMLQKIRRNVLHGCRIAIFSSKSVPKYHRTWSMAQELGATCVIEADSSTTHVVSTKRESPGAQWAVQNNKFVVSSRWIKVAYHLWHRQPEEHFLPPA